jgi:hypothetical protein
MKEVSLAIFNKDTHESRCFVASGAFYKGRLIAIETNKPKFHKFNKINLRTNRTGELFVKPGSCAEALLISRLQRHTQIPFSKIEVVTLRIDKSLRMTMAKPCDSCQKAFDYFQFKNLFFTNKEGNFVQHS